MTVEKQSEMTVRFLGYLSFEMDDRGSDLSALKNINILESISSQDWIFVLRKKFIPLDDLPDGTIAPLGGLWKTFIIGIKPLGFETPEETVARGCLDVSPSSHRDWIEPSILFGRAEIEAPKRGNWELIRLGYQYFVAREKSPQMLAEELALNLASHIGAAPKTTKMRPRL